MSSMQAVFTDAQRSR